jgi:hypothetical protein
MHSEQGKLKNLIIGDFQTQFGQGLMLSVLGMEKGGPFKHYGEVTSGSCLTLL